RPPTSTLFPYTTLFRSRFHAAIPDETETQFVSGLGHLVEAAVAIALLIPFARRHTMTDWLWAHTVALTYWTFQVAVLTPPWFALDRKSTRLNSSHDQIS